MNMFSREKWTERSGIWFESFSEPTTLRAMHETASKARALARLSVSARRSFAPKRVHFVRWSRGRLVPAGVVCFPLITALGPVFTSSLSTSTYPRTSRVLRQNIISLPSQDTQVLQKRANLTRVCPRGEFASLIGPTLPWGRS